MWARVAEIAAAAWLASQARFLAGADARVDVAFAAAFFVLAALSFARRTSRAHLLELPIACALVLHGWLATRDAPTAAAQSHILTGMIVAMLAIVPSHASRPPRAWIEHEERGGAR